MKLSAWGEEKAAAYLEERGYQILDRNYRCRIGELDLVAREGDYLVIVEVKTRQSLNYGLPCESINATKQRHIRRTAQWYVIDKGFSEPNLRLDVVEILRMNGTTYVHHIENAF